MTSNISDLVKVDDKKLWQAMNDGYAHFEDFKRDVLAALTPSEPVVEVKEGYCIQATKWDADHDSKRAPLSEALTIRTADEVRREALDVASEYMNKSYGIGALSHPVDRARVIALIDTPAQSPDKTMSVAEADNRVESICRELRNAGYMVPVSVLDRALYALNHKETDEEMRACHHCKKQTAKRQLSCTWCGIWEKG